MGSENKGEGLVDIKNTSSTDLTEQSNLDYINTTRRKSKRSSKVPKKFEHFDMFKFTEDEGVSRKFEREDDLSLPEQESRPKNDSVLYTPKKRSSNSVNASEPKKKKQKE